MLGLWFLRMNERFWSVVAVAALAFAVMGLVAVLSRLAPGASARFPLELLWLAQLLGVPIWFAALCEAVIGVCAALHWFAPG